VLYQHIARDYDVACLEIQTMSMSNLVCSTSKSCIDPISYG